MSTDPTETAVAALHPALAALEASGADRFNPVRFRYIKAMASRSLKQGDAVADLVAKRALAALQTYQAELSRQQVAAAALVEQITERTPASAQHARALFAAGDFRAVVRLAARCQRPLAGGQLTSLVQRLNARSGPALDTPEAGPISELLREQEAEALRTVRAAAANAPMSPPPATNELKAARYFRDARQQQRADTLVTRAVTEAPQDSGPLNPQKLVIRSLAAMRDLSPAYLGRFVSYVDTLFWLENTGEKHKS